MFICGGICLPKDALLSDPTDDGYTRALPSSQTAAHPSSVHNRLVCFSASLSCFRTSQRQYEEEATSSFYRSRATYDEILGTWTMLFPAKCGGTPPAPGLVSLDLIAFSDDHTYALELNDRHWQTLDASAVASRLSAPRDYVTSLIAATNSVGSLQIFQSWQVLQIVDHRNSTRGILHIDPSCSDASDLESWSKHEWNPNEGRYTGLRHLGDGWYYYAENS